MPPSRGPERMVPDLLVTGVRVWSGRGRGLLALDRLAVPAGQSVAVMGASGAGKSTLLYVLSGLLPPDEGQVLWAGQDIAALNEAGRAAIRRHSFGLVFQDYHLFEELSALGNAALAAAFAPRAARAALVARAGGWLARLGLAGLDARSVASCSGGERQRIAVARALACEPPVILADEPTASLDRAAADALGADLAQLARADGRTLIAVTHHPAFAARLDRRLVIADGRIIEDSHD